MRLFSSLPLALSLSLIAPVTIASAGSGDPCQTTIKEQIASLAIPKERIRDVSILDIYEGNAKGGGLVDHIEGWVSFNDCKGNLVINVSRTCIPLQTYTTYECRVPGVANY